MVADAGSNEDFTAYTGIKNAPTIAAGKTDGYKTDVFFYCKNGKMVTVMFVLPQSKVTIEDDNNKMIFFAKESGLIWSTIRTATTSSTMPLSMVKSRP